MAFSIKTKVVFPVLLLALIMGALVASAWYALNETTKLNASLAGRFDEIEEVRRIEVLFSELIYPHLEYITTYSQEAKQRIQDTLHKIDHIVKDLNDMEVVNAEEREITEVVTQEAEAIRKISDQIIQARVGHDNHDDSSHGVANHSDANHSDANHSDAMSHMGHDAATMSDSTMTPMSHNQQMILLNEISTIHIHKVSEALREWHVEEAHEVDKLAEKTREQLHQFSAWVIAFAVLMSVVVIFALWLNNYVLIRPVVSLSRSTNQFASGDLKQKAPIYAEDELGGLARDINHMAASLDGLYNQMATMAKTDQLTGLMNRHGFMEVQARECSSVNRYNHPLSLAIIDIDNFKQVNDTFGHAVGDIVIRAVAETCTEVFRDCDYCFRYGGEEFVVLMPQTSANNAMGAVERLRQAVEAKGIKAEGQTLQVTVSAGVAQFAGDSGDDLVKQADEALYEAKETGRNKVVSYEQLSREAGKS